MSLVSPRAARRARSSFGLRGLALVLLLAVTSHAQWLNPPRLHNPTWSTVSVAGVAEVDMQVRFAGGGERIDFVRAGELWTRVVSAPAEVTVQTRPIHSRFRWTDGPTLQLRPLPGPLAPSVTVAVASDTHAWALLSKSGPTPSAALQFVQRAMDNIAAREPDLLVHNGDFAMTWCGGCQAVGPSATAGSVDTLDDALQRCRAAWGPELLGRAGNIPALTVMGDHEGLMPWVSVPGFPSEVVGTLSAEALARTLPIPGSAPDGSFLRGPEGTLSWALRSGELLLIGLDVHSHMQTKPLSPDDWQLAGEHLAWFESVLAQPMTHKVVIAEHILGGLSSPTGNEWKARSSIRATDDGTVSGTFRGGQAAVHALMVEHGGDVFLTGHDHLAALGFKDGVAYLSGGRAGGVGHPWADQAWYGLVMDYDGDGVAEYDSDVTGTRRPGHFELEAHSGGNLEIRYIRAALGAANGSELLSFVLPP